jgi:hypothetical protein
MRRSPILCSLLLAAATASCADDASVNVKYAQGYTPGRASVSVLGVFRDGRMSVEAWTSLGPLVSSSLGASTADVCEVAFSERLQHQNEELFTSIDAEVRNEGITEDLLTKLAPRAQGDLILTITVHGAIAATAPDTTRSPPPRGAPPGPSMGARGRSPRGAGTYREVPRGTSARPLELSASLFSISRHQQVAKLSMSYTGTSVEEASRRFATEVGAMVPGGSCKGWTFPTATPASVAPILEGP